MSSVRSQWNILLALLWLASPLGAQTLTDESHGSGSDESTLEEVIVTGSRIKRSNLDAPSPVILFDADDLLNNGITTMGEFSRYLPQTADSFSDSMTNGSPLRGSAAFNLRGIGLDGTLTLINGRRVAPFGSSGDLEPFVDINSIPVASIDRIEVLKDGASAIYGSEAVAGVVNIITRKQIEGVTIDAGYMTTTHGDGAEWDVNIAGGWSNESTRLTGTLSYFDRSIIWKRDRDWASNLDFRDRGGFNFRSSFSSPPTLRPLERGGALADPECPVYNESASREVIIPGVFEFCRFNWAYYMSLQQPSDRLGLTGSLEHDFASGLQLFAEILLNENDTYSVMAPTPIPRFFVPAYHPNNPIQEDLLVQARALDTGDRAFTTEATTWRAIAGLRGALASWDWEAAVMASEAESVDTLLNAILAEEYQAALLGFGGPNGDQFYNPFGANPNNAPEVIEQLVISGPQTFSNTRELTLDLQVTGSFGYLPGGPVGAAFGIQARAQDLDQNADEITRTGNLVGSGGFEPISVDREIWSTFAEFMLPLHDTLEAQLAIRYDHYSDFGSTTNPKVGLGWRPREDMLIRATWGTSFRPPTFRELYDPRVEFDDFIRDDPWRCPVTGDVFDCFGIPFQGSSQGNPELQPDEGETWLLGFAWEPLALRGFSWAVDLWQIEHENRILYAGDFFLSQVLLDGVDPFLNPFFTRAPQSPTDLELGIPGPIIQSAYSYVNGDTLTANGIDMDVRYEWVTDQAGLFKASLNYAYLNEYEVGINFLNLETVEDRAGWYGFVSGLPRHRGNLNLTWNLDGHSASVLIPYAGTYDSWQNLVITDEATGISEETDQRYEIDDYWQLDLQYSYVFESLKSGQLRLGCRNCLDEDPPVYNQTVDAEPFHEGRGAMVYVRWSQPF